MVPFKDFLHSFWSQQNSVKHNKIPSIILSPMRYADDTSACSLSFYFLTALTMFKLVVTCYLYVWPLMGLPLLLGSCFQPTLAASLSRRNYAYRNGVCWRYSVLDVLITRLFTILTAMRRLHSSSIPYYPRQSTVLVRWRPLLFREFSQPKLGDSLSVLGAM